MLLTVMVEAESVTGDKLYLPEPLVSRYRWFETYKSYAGKYGLKLSEDGKVSSRGFTSTLCSMLRRDASSLKVPTPDRPWHPCFGIDHTSVSQRREFAHAGITYSHVGIARRGGCPADGARKVRPLAAW